MRNDRFGANNRSLIGPAWTVNALNWLRLTGRSWLTACPVGIQIDEANFPIRP